MIEPTFKVDERQLTAALEKFPPNLQRALRDPLARWAGQALGMVQGQEPFRTGDLRSHTQSFVDERPDYSRARVRVLNVDGKHNLKAAALEYGSRSLVTVKAHSMSLGHFWDRPGFADVGVPSYPRITNIKADHFLRNVFQATQASAKNAIEAAINETVKTL